MVRAASSAPAPAARPRRLRRYLAAIEGAKQAREREQQSLVRATIAGTMVDDMQVGWEGWGAGELPGGGSCRAGELLALHAPEPAS